MQGRLSSAQARTLCLGVAVVVNVAWSYCVMHLGRYGIDPSLDPMTCVALPCYVGYIAGGLPMMLWPGRAEELACQKGLLPALALMMMFVAVLLGFAPVQHAFSMTLFVIFANFVSGLVCAFSKAVTYVPLIMQASRMPFLGAVLSAHCIVYLLSEAFTITYSTLMLMIVFVLPVVMIALVRYGASPNLVSPQGPDWPALRGKVRPLAAIACAALVVTLCDCAASSRGWIVSLDSMPPSASPLVAVATVVFGCLLAIATAQAVRWLKLPNCYQLFFAVMLVGLMASAGDEPLFAIPSIYPHAMFWLLVYDVSRRGMMAPMQAFGAHIVILHGLDLAWAFVEGTAAVTPLMLAFYAGALCLTAASPLRHPEPLWLPTDRPVGARDISRCLNEICAQAAREYGLSEREREVLYLLAQGRARRVICSELSLSEGTVRSHTTHIYAKLGVHSSNELIDKIYGDAGQS